MSKPSFTTTWGESLVSGTVMVYQIRQKMHVMGHWKGKKEASYQYECVMKSERKELPLFNTLQAQK